MLDWELCTLGNPWADVAYMCLAYHMPQQLPMMRLASPLPEGVPDERALLARYCAARGVAPPSPRDWAFYLALSLFRLLSILAGVQARARQGNASSASAAALSRDEVLDALADAALGIVDRAAAVEGGGGGSGGGDGGARPPAPRAAPSLGAPSPRAAELLARVRAFVSEHVLPAEAALTAHAHGEARWTIHPLAEELKARARAAGLWNLWLPRDMAARLAHLAGEVPEGERASLLGAGLSNLDYAHLCGAMGRSVWAPEVFNCSAPDTGNMEVLARCARGARSASWGNRTGRAGCPQLRVRPKVAACSHVCQGLVGLCSSPSPSQHLYTHLNTSSPGTGRLSSSGAGWCRCCAAASGRALR